jgi:hypothetical protein
VPLHNSAARASIHFQGGDTAETSFQSALAFFSLVHLGGLTLMMLFGLSPVPPSVCPGTLLFALLVPLLIVVCGPVLLIERLAWLILAPLLQRMGYEPYLCMCRGACAFPVAKRLLDILDARFGVVRSADTLLGGVDSLTQEIQDAAVQRLLQAERDEDAESTNILLGKSDAMAFPKTVKPETFVNWACGCLPLPGKLGTGLAFFVADLFTDANQWGVFLRSGHYLFAGVLAVTSWTSTLTQFREGRLTNMFYDAMQSSVAGVSTHNWISLLDTEKSLEGVVQSLVQGYALCFAGLKFPEVVMSAISLDLSFLGVATYLQESGDLEHVSIPPTEMDAPAAVIWLVHLLELLVIGGFVVELVCVAFYANI